VRVSEIVRETSQAVTVFLEPEDGRPLGFSAGQYLTHCFEINGAPARRAYSLSSPEGGRIACTIKAIDGGLASDFIARRLRTGDRYSILGPSGDFVLDAGTDTPLAFLAGGSGITPVMGLIETALARAPSRRIRLVYANRSEGEIIFASRLTQLQQRHPNLEVVHVLSRPGAGWHGEAGRLDAQRAASLLLLDGASYYLCGPSGLMDAAEQGLQARGVAAPQIRRERFLAAARAVGTRPTAAQEIVFRRSHKLVTQKAGETILEAGLREGLALPFSCTVGGCGSCKMHVVEGEVSLNEPNCLSPQEHAAGFTLACSAYALGRLVVEA
jgi:ferredoxin-NADP reductase